MKDIGYGYFATEDGKIYSSKTNNYVSQRIGERGYFLVNLSINGKCKTFQVHRLIAKAYIDNKEKYPVVNHLDGNKLNNSVSNLEWTTYKGNFNHAKAIGLLNTARGIRTNNGRFTPEDIKNIRSLVKEKSYSFRRVAEIYNVTKSAIQQIVNRNTYWYIP